MPSTQAQCVVCRSDRFREDKAAAAALALKSPFSVVKCFKCGFRWLDPQPDEREYALLYDLAYAEHPESHEAYTHSWLRDYSLVPGDYETERKREKERRIRARLDQIQRHAPNARSVLEVGIGTGEFLLEARKRGLEVAGLDLSEQSCSKARKEQGLDVYCGSLYDYDPSGRRFDVVHLHHVFEHLLDPRRALLTIRSLLDEQGILALEVPNEFESLSYLVKRWLPGGPQPQRTLWSVAHPYFYARPHLERIVKDSGFGVVHVTTFFRERAGRSRWHGPQNVIRNVADRLGGRGTNIELFATPG